MKIGHLVNQPNALLNLKAGHVIRAVIKKGRYITWLKAALAMRFKFPKVTAPGAFNLSGTAYIGESSGPHNMLVGLSSSSDNYISFVSSGEIRIRLAGTTLDSINANISKNKRLYVVVQRDELDELTITVNGEVKVVGVLSGDFVIDRAGTFSSTFFFNGFISEINCISGFVQEGNDKGNPHYRFDKNYLIDGNHTSVVENWNALETEELRQDFVTGLMGTATLGIYDPLTGLGQCSRVDIFNLSFVQITDLISDSVYLVCIENTGEVLLSTRKNRSSTVINTISPGSTKEFILSTKEFQDFRVQCNAGTGSFIIHSFKEAPGYAEAININNSNTEYFEEQDDGSLLSTIDLWDYGVAIATGAEGAFSRVAGEFGGALDLGATHQWEVSSSNITDGSLRLSAAGSILHTAIDASIASGVSFQTSNTNLLVAVGPVQCNAGATADVSFKRLIQ